MQLDSGKSISLPDIQIYAAGFLLLYKRLELGGFSLPRTKEEALEITPEQYQALMKGLEIISRHPIQEVYPQDLL